MNYVELSKGPPPYWYKIKRNTSNGNWITVASHEYTDYGDLIEHLDNLWKPYVILNPRHAEKIPNYPWALDDEKQRALIQKGAKYAQRLGQVTDVQVGQVRRGAFGKDWTVVYITGGKKIGLQKAGVTDLQNIVYEPIEDVARMPLVSEGNYAASHTPEKNSVDPDGKIFFYWHNKDKWEWRCFKNRRCQTIGDGTYRQSIDAEKQWAAPYTFRGRPEEFFGKALKKCRGQSDAEFTNWLATREIAERPYEQAKAITATYLDQANDYWDGPSYWNGNYYEAELDKLLAPLNPEGRLALLSEISRALAKPKTATTIDHELAKYAKNYRNALLAPLAIITFALIGGALGYFLGSMVIMAATAIILVVSHVACATK